MSEEKPSEDNTANDKGLSDLGGMLAALNARKSEFDQLVSSATTAIQQEVDKAKNKLTEMEQLKTEVATAKGAIEATVAAASNDRGIVAQSKADIEALKSAATELSRKLDDDHNDITAKISALREQEASLENVLTELSNSKVAAEADNQAAKTSVTEIGNAKAQFVNLATDTQAQYDGLVQRQNALHTKIEEIEDANIKITGLRRSLLENSDDAQSVQDQIGDLRAQIATILEDVSNRRNEAVTAFEEFKKKTETGSETMITSLNKRFDSLHNTLQERILALLPSAGAAGLASTYYDAKSRYAPTSFAGRLGDKIATGRLGWLRKWFGYNPASVVATVFFYALFGFPLLFIIYESVSLLFRIENDPHFVLRPEMLAVRFLIVLPLATFSGFGFASLQLYRKLYEEYNHKQRVMELYGSFSEEIKTNGDDEQKKALITIMLNSVAHKAWDSAHKEETKSGTLDPLATLERLTDDIAKLKGIVGH